MSKSTQFNAATLKAIADLEITAKQHSKAATAENTLRNGAVIGIYTNIVAELNSLPKVANGRPTAQVGKDLVTALQEHAGMKPGGAKRYWDTGAAVIQKMRKEKAIPTQASAEFVAAFFAEKEITSQNQLQVWAGTVATKGDLPEQAIDILYGKRNKSTGKRMSQLSDKEHAAMMDRFMSLVGQENIERSHVKAAMELAKAEKIKYSEAMSKLMGAEA